MIHRLHSYLSILKESQTTRNNQLFVLGVTKHVPEELLCVQIHCIKVEDGVHKQLYVHVNLEDDGFNIVCHYLLHCRKR